ncbi:MAG: hypothetical protein RL722_623 [Pseudomonadota bacterium]|jgi:sigma-E factor negative regulatory protein RseB
MTAGLAGDTAALLRRLDDARRIRNYAGTFVITAAGAMSSSRIARASDGGTDIERIESLDGQRRRVYRQKDQVRIFWPGSRRVSIEPAAGVRGFPSALATDGPGALEMYEVVPGGEDRVAGLDAQVYNLRPRDSARFMQRWWLDRSSGLLLRADMVNERGEVLESAAFSELQLAARVPYPQLQAEMNRLDGYRVVRSRMVDADLEREGWALKLPVAGFKPVQCVQRLLPEPPPHPHRPPPPMAGQGSGLSQGLSPGAPPDGSAGLRPGQAPGPMPPPPPPGPGAGGEPSVPSVLQAVFSDGLTHVSLFIEPYRPGIHQQEPVVAMGATHALSRRLGEWWITAVGDVPPATLRQFALALERRKP